MSYKIQNQDRKKRITDQLESFLVTAKEADQNCTDITRKTVSDILKVALEEKKTEIRGGHLFNKAFVTIGDLGKDNEALQNLGSMGEKRINDINQKIHDLDVRYQKASEKLAKFEYDTLVMVLRALGNLGLEGALDYCLNDQQFKFQRR